MYDFSFSRLLSNVNKYYFRHAKLLLFRGLRNVTFEEMVEKLKKDLEARGEKFDETMLKIDEKKATFTLKRKKKQTKQFVRRKSADYLRKYDYRKLNFEIKKLQKK